MYLFYFLAFWLGIQRNPDTGSWYNPYDLSRDFTYFELEVASESQNCAYNFNGDLIPSSCSGSSPCGICQVPKEKVNNKIEIKSTPLSNQKIHSTLHCTVRSKSLLYTNSKTTLITGVVGGAAADFLVWGIFWFYREVDFISISIKLWDMYIFYLTNQSYLFI